MSHMLMFCFQYHRYLKDATLRVYSDDRLVDESTLSEDIKLKTVAIDKITSGAIGPKNQCPVDILPEKLFIYEIPDQHLTDHITIEVLHEFNNYTNGFMTEFAYVKLYNLFLIPKCLLEFDNWGRISRINQYDRNYNCHSYPRRPRHDELAIFSLDGKNIHVNWHDTVGVSFQINAPLHDKHGVKWIGKPDIGKYSFNRKIERLIKIFKVLNTTT